MNPSTRETDALANDFGRNTEGDRTTAPVAIARYPKETCGRAPVRLDREDIELGIQKLRGGAGMGRPRGPTWHARCDPSTDHSRTLHGYREVHRRGVTALRTRPGPRRMDCLMRLPRWRADEGHKGIPLRASREGDGGPQNAGPEVEGSRTRPSASSQCRPIQGAPATAVEVVEHRGTRLATEPATTPIERAPRDEAPPSTLDGDDGEGHGTAR